MHTAILIYALSHSHPLLQIYDPGNPDFMAGFKLDALGTLAPSDDKLFNKGGYMGTGALAAVNFNAMIQAQEELALGYFRLDPAAYQYARLSLAQFSTQSYQYWNFTRFKTATEIVDGFDNLFWQTGSTNTHTAITEAQAKLTTDGRVDANKVMVLVTDGSPSNVAEAKAAAKATRDAGTNLFIMGYGAEVSQSGPQATLLEMVGGDTSSLLIVNSVADYTSDAYRQRLAQEYIDVFCFAPNTAAPTAAPTSEPTTPVPTKPPTSTPSPTS